MKSIKWNKLRILVTNKCNYQCPFCHNEGQEKGVKFNMMSFDSFKMLIDFLNDQQISEINFSGGEPFLHKEIVKMICYADQHMKCDISCATNLSLITDEQIDILKGTRVKFNIQFPFISEKEFSKSTGIGNLYNIIDKIKIIKKSGINIGLNTVIQSPDYLSIENIIRFALENDLPLKLLPQIGLKGSNQFVYNIRPMLEKNAVSFIDKGTGALKWIIQSGDHQTSVLYIDSPCFRRDIKTCRNYGEIRVLPDFKLQSCILKEANVQLNLDEGKDYVINQFEGLWNDFNQC